MNIYTDTTITSADVDQTSPPDALATSECDSPARTPVAELTDAIGDTRIGVAHNAEIFEAALDPKDHSVERDDTTVDSDLVADVFPDDPSCEAVTTILDLIATIHTHLTLHSVALSSLTEGLDVDPYLLYRTLSNLPGVDCSLEDDLPLTSTPFRPPRREG
ncbi:hypothetical protein [Salinigranum halophilum]|uniref:hypothetical protein n=1 Tax=Salinigranum halophilum TaxID=2565931 RepID=UPI0010A79F1F|nr:hypothetical protein [Salinigranum halophilum]